jgi:hypothetical protein
VSRTAGENINGALPIPGPLGLGDLLDRAFRLLQAHFWLFAATAAIFLVPYSVLRGILASQWSDAGVLAGVLSLIINTSLDVLVTGFVTLALTCQSIALLHGQWLPLREGFRCGWRCFWPYIGMSILQGLAVASIILVMFFPSRLIGTISGVGGNLVGLPSHSITDLALIRFSGSVIRFYGVVLLVMMLIMLPMCYLFARWLAAIPSLVAEHWGPVEALRRSWQLTRGQVWRSIGYLVLLGVLGWLSTALPVWATQQFVSILLGPGARGLAAGLSTGLGYNAHIVWLPLQTAATVLLYYDLRVRKEGYDLALRVEQIEAGLIAGKSDQSTGVRSR